MPAATLRRALLAMHAALCAVVVRASLRAGSVPFAVRAASSAGSLCRTRATIDECAAAATVAAARLSHPTCLYRALTAYALLAHRHDATRFHLGTTVAGGMGAHAWVSVGDRALDLEAAQYSPLWASR